MLCQYKHVFGVEKQGVHSYRILDIAIVDVVLTIVAAWMASMFFQIHFAIVFLLLMLLGVLLHRLFCVNTTISRVIFGET